MARSDWGGTSGDLSGTFLGLANQEQSQSVAAANRAITQSQDQQDAADQDMYSKWKNGLITDQQWLDYIGTRVDATKSDPKQHQQWVDTQRQYTNSIADSQIESAYTRGEVSINDLIAHYSTRLSGLQQNSDEYRTIQDHYYQLVDKRDGDYIDTTSRDILAKINRGQAGYGALLSFYQSMDKKVRSSSSLKGQIRNNIQSIQDIVDGVSGGSGGGSGSSGSSTRRASSGGGSGAGANDPYSVASKAVVKLWTSGNVFSPGGNDVVRSVLDIYKTDTTNQTDVWNALADDSAVIENIMQDAADHPDAAYLTTPWGDQIPNTPQMRQMIMNQALRTYDYRIALGHAEGRSTISVQNARHDFVRNTFSAQNDLNASDYINQVQQNVWEDLTIASQDPNPDSALTSYKSAGNALDRMTHDLLGEKALPTPPHGAESAVTPGTSAAAGPTQYGPSTLFPEEQLSPDLQKNIKFSQQLAQLLKAAPTMSSEEFQHEASILMDQRPSAYWLKDTQLQDVLGNNQVTSTLTGFGNDVKVGQGVIGKIAASEGLRAAYDVAHGNPSVGIEPYIYVAAPGGTPMAVPRSSAAQILGIKGDMATATRGGWETVGGETTWVIRPLQPIAPPQWYQNGNGQYLTADQYAKIGRNAAALAQAGWSLKPVNELAGWSKIVDGDGITWYVDPEDGHLYQNLPLKAGISGPATDIANLVNSRGQIDVNSLREPAATDMGFVTWWTKDIPRSQVEKMTQDMINNDQQLVAAGLLDPQDQHINLDYFHRRDPNTNSVGVQGLSENDVTGMFWTPADKLLEWRHNEQTDPMNYGETAFDTFYRTELRRRAAIQDAFDKGYENVKQAFQQHQQDMQQGTLPPSIQDGLRAAGISLGKVQDIQNQETKLAPIPAPQQVIKQVAPVSLDTMPVPKPTQSPPPYVPPVNIPTLPPPPPPKPIGNQGGSQNNYSGKQKNLF